MLPGGLWFLGCWVGFCGFVLSFGAYGCVSDG